MKNPQLQTGQSMMTGILVGLAVGLVAIAGVMYVLNKNKPSYDNLKKNQQQTASAESNVEFVSPLSASDHVVEFKPEARVPVPAEEPASAPVAAKESVETIQHSLPPTEPQQLGTMTVKSKPEKTPKEAAKSSVKQPASSQITPISKRSYLQIGAYKELAQAESQKAKLAFIGVEAQIYEVNLGEGKGILHRVRVGPFTNEEQLSQTRNTLKSNGVDATVMN